ncbi:Non-functional NADPH-dependent codeinone reductase 2 [Bienertia sinuspersici]
MKVSNTLITLTPNNTQINIHLKKYPSQIKLGPLRLGVVSLSTQPKMTTNEVAPPRQLSVPEIKLSHGGRSIPVMGLGTAVDPPVSLEDTKSAVIRAMEVGYRHFDTAHKYKSEQPIGEAVQEALSLGLIQSRDELFITSKLWCGDAHPDLVVPGLKKSLRNLKMDWIDLYLIHWPLSCQPGKTDFPIKEDDFLPMDFQGVWAAMEECQKLGLAKCIGVSNFSCKKLEHLLAIANFPPAVNQVEVNPFWQQKKLIDLCRENGILITAYSPLGAIGTFYGSNRILESEVLQEIAKSKGKSIPQVCLRWLYEQGVSVVVKSFNKERMKENLKIFDWELTEEEHEKIRGIPQSRGVTGWPYLSEKGPFKTLEELWDGEI